MEHFLGTDGRQEDPVLCWESDIKHCKILQEKRLSVRVCGFAGDLMPYQSSVRISKTNGLCDIKRNLHTRALAARK